MQKDFISVTPDSGTGNSSITVSVTENHGDQRSTSLLVSGGGISKSLSITQEKGSVLVTNFRVNFVSDINQVGMNATDQFLFVAGIYDVDNKFKDDGYYMNPGQYPSSAGVYVDITSDDQVYVSDPRSVKARIMIQPFNVVDPTPLKSVRISSVASPPDGWTSDITGVFTRTVSKGYTLWTNPSTNFYYSNILQFDAVLPGSVTEGNLGTFILTLSKQ